MDDIQELIEHLLSDRERRPRRRAAGPGTDPQAVPETPLAPPRPPPRRRTRPLVGWQQCLAEARLWIFVFLSLSLNGLGVGGGGTFVWSFVVKGRY